MRPLILMSLLLLASSCTRTSVETADHHPLFPIEEDGKWGYIDSTGQVVIAPRFEKALPFEGSLAPVRHQGKFGYIDRSGAFAIAPRYQDAWYFSDGVAPVQSGNRWVYIDTTGTMLQQASFSPALSVLEAGSQLNSDLVPLQEGGRYGYRMGDRWQIPPAFEQAQPFVNGLARVRQNGKWGYIDPTGQFLIPARFTHTWDFQNGLALVEEEGKRGYINRNGAYVWSGTN